MLIGQTASFLVNHISLKVDEHEADLVGGDVDSCRVPASATTDRVLAFRPPVDWYSPASRITPASVSSFTFWRTVGILKFNAEAISGFDAAPFFKIKRAILERLNCFFSLLPAGPIVKTSAFGNN